MSRSSTRLIAGYAPHVMDIMRDRIKERLKATGLSPRAASLNAGYGPDLIRDFFRHPKNRMLTDTVAKLARTLKTSAAYLLGETNDPSGDGIERKPIPILDYASAGNWAQSGEAEAMGRVMTDYPVGDNGFALIVRGASMLNPEGREPNFHEGDLIIFDPDIEPAPGDFVIAKLDDDHETTFKQYRLRRGTAGGNVVELVPLNPSYPILVLDRKTPGKLIATAVEQRRYLRRITEHGSRVARNVSS